MKLLSRAVTAAAVFGFALSAVAAYAAPTPAAPSAPRNLKATAGDQQVSLTWSPPTSGAPITQYRVIVSPGSLRTSTAGTNVLVAGLTNGTTYSFAVQAANASGYGQAARTTATPHVIPPSAPTNLAATSGPGAGQMTLSWTPPKSNGSGPNIDHYTVTYSPGGTSATVPSPATTYQVSGLADNVTYTFKVSATNSRGATGPAATVYAPLPPGANIGLQPAAGGANTSITATGSLFLKNESITLYWDVASHVAASVVTDDTGAFTKVVKPFAGDKPKVHKLCASVQPHPCASFSLQGPPTPTPGETPSPVETPTPTPAETPQASGARPGGGISGLDIITRPPFVFLPILAILGILGVLAYWLFSRRRQVPPTSAATVVHRATRPDYMAPFPTSATTPAPPPPPVQPSAWDAPVQTAPPAQPYVPTPYVPPPVPPQAPPPPAPPAAPPRAAEWPAPQNLPAAPDEPPDLPQPSD
ncbi:MAG: fibronectin type III domain-containing protein [Candidatus Dormiibacterota bacterium]